VFLTHFKLFLHPVLPDELTAACCVHLQTMFNLSNTSLSNGYY